MSRLVELTRRWTARASTRTWPRQNSPMSLGLIVIQEIFGVTAHIRAVADDYANHGYTVLAPCLFDRIETGVELACDDAGMARGARVGRSTGFRRASARRARGGGLASCTESLCGGHRRLLLGRCDCFPGGNAAGLASGQLLRSAGTAIPARTTAGAVDVPLWRTRCADPERSRRRHRTPVARGAACTAIPPGTRSTGSAIHTVTRPAPHGQRSAHWPSCRNIWGRAAHERIRT